MAELDIVKSVFLFSEKCTMAEVIKLEEDYKIDLQKNRYPTKSHLNRYLKVTDKSKAKADANKPEKTEEEESLM